jgi:hypothetical protein
MGCPDVEVHLELLTHQGRSQHFVVGSVWLVVVQYFHVRRHGSDELFQSHRCGVRCTEGYQEKQAECFELSLGLVVGLGMLMVLSFTT